MRLKTVTEGVKTVSEDFIITFMLNTKLFILEDLKSQISN